ncbi:MAG TPA: DUF1820 family protein [Gammaproteobacteria bacterium]|nr:DUF1820 family protein [Gammaproteobacteria bacterium]
MPSKPIYKVLFLNQGKVYEIYARHVSQTGSLFGFVEVGEIVFDSRKGVVVDPSEERLKVEFADVRKTYLPMHYVLRIDEVDKQGVSKITTADGGNVAQFPMPMYTPSGQGSKGGPHER